jgi:hypothetical protein
MLRMNQLANWITNAIISFTNISPENSLQKGSKFQGFPYLNTSLSFQDWCTSPFELTTSNTPKADLGKEGNLVLTILGNP